MDREPPLGLVEREDVLYVPASRDSDPRWHRPGGRAVRVPKARVRRDSDGKVVTDHRQGYTGLRRYGLGREASPVHLHPLRMRRCTLGLRHRPAVQGTEFIATPIVVAPR